MFKISVPTEIYPGESRVAISPDIVKKFVALGVEVSVQAGAGEKSRITDAAYQEAGAGIVKTAKAAFNGDIVLKVHKPVEKEFSYFRNGVVLIAILDPYGDMAMIEKLVEAKVNAFAMEFIPRITRAQSMDVLSSQANLAGYQAVIDASVIYDRALPMMMTAAGTVPAAKVFVMGAGVAGLQAIATARRLGAVVSATDVRPAVKEQVESLGAKFVAIEDDEFREAETSGGYAKEMSDDYQKKQAELIAKHIEKQDIVITTALIPGRTAPRLVDKEMVQSMRSGSVLVDLAVERGGNIEGAKSGEIVRDGNVTIVGYNNMPSRIAASASELYSKNLYTFVETMIDKENGCLKIDWEDEIIAATALTCDGAVIHPQFQTEGG